VRRLKTLSKTGTAEYALSHERLKQLLAVRFPHIISLPNQKKKSEFGLEEGQMEIEGAGDALTGPYVTAQQRRQL
jgi:hypothetical protein